MPAFIDTHAHLHFDAYATREADYLARARAAGVEIIITVGVSIDDTRLAIACAGRHPEVYATAGIHPTDGAADTERLEELRPLAQEPKVVAIGECGFDFFHKGVDKATQEHVFRYQIELALELDLPLVFHVREGFDDFYRVLADYPEARGILHCFTGNQHDLERALERDLAIALNGIATYTKVPEQIKAFKSVPLSNLVLETDCPFLAPVPFRGQLNQPAYIKEIATCLSDLRGENVGEIADATSANAQKVFNINSV